MHPPIRVTLTTAQWEELDRLQRQRLIDRRLDRRLAMSRCVAEGATIPQAAGLLGLHEQTVRKFVKRFLAAGFVGLADRPRTGRPPTVGSADLDAVAARLTEDAQSGARTWTLPQAAAWLAEERGGQVSPKHLGELLKRRDFVRKRTKRSSHHQRTDEARQVRKEVDLALLPFCRGRRRRA